MTPSPELTLTSLSLLEAIRVASQPGCVAKVYVPATRDAVRLMRIAYRQYVALEARIELRKLLARPRSLTGLSLTELQRDYDQPNAYIGLGRWTGD